ncbi:L-lactate dehydrogenase (cytochrome) [Roseovarius nanhaiticus]|uniref:L-lactate dehydrogenase (Cytochrome) n=2 Tax=Roseovarius nanhaiticus TaxID=573024 RepID=A0A1N7HDW6_9RHOB|nr:L-lactate dehydrogenase (cytochrome) [Roseovarius nanhaiticus]SIS22880.1 L-lactate dehydrogenase (cytochrome) [Roseovarius nanhaiticus]
MPRMSHDSTYPAIADLKARARARLPRFVWEYLDSGTGTERARHAGPAALQEVEMMPSILHGEFAPDLTTTLFGRNMALPFGIGPVGMSGLIWPDAEGHLARAAAKADMPYTLSTVAAQTPEDVAPHLGAHGWFQLYPPRDEGIRRDMLERAKASGFSVLVLTVDVPVASRRERQTRSGLTQPPRLTPRLMAQVAMRPAWAMGMAQRGMPRMRMIDKYAGDTSGLPSTAHAGYLLRTSPDAAYLDWLRAHWDGPLVVKGVLDPADLPMLEAAGVDAVWISNHGGRQFDGAPASARQLPLMRAATDLPLIFDGGITGGLDILRAIALGASFVMMARPWHYALAALGPEGLDHLVRILTADMTANMGQLGARSLPDLPARLISRV